MNHIEEAIEVCDEIVRRYIKAEQLELKVAAPGMRSLDDHKHIGADRRGGIDVQGIGDTGGVRVFIHEVQWVRQIRSA